MSSQTGWSKGRLTGNWGLTDKGHRHWHDFASLFLYVDNLILSYFYPCMHNAYLISILDALSQFFYTQGWFIPRAGAYINTSIQSSI